MTSAAAISILVFWVAPMLLAIRMGSAKRRTGWGYGLFGWLGVLVLAFRPAFDDPAYGECPFCREAIRVDATVCPHCQRDVSPAPQT